jgi:hypothetical protein
MMKIYEIDNIFIFINWVLKNNKLNEIVIVYPIKKKVYYNLLFKIADLSNNIIDKDLSSKYNLIKNKYIYFVESELININKVPKNSNFITYNFDLLYFSKCNIIHEYLAKHYYFNLLDNVKIIPSIKININKKELVLDDLKKNVYLLALLVNKKIISKTKLNKLLLNEFKKTSCNICYQNKKTINTCCNLDICMDCLLNQGFKKCCPICKKYHKIKDINFIIPRYLENYFEINKNHFILNNYLLNMSDLINNINLYFDMTDFYFLNNKEINLYTII